MSDPTPQAARLRSRNPSPRRKPRVVRSRRRRRRRSLLRFRRKPRLRPRSRTPRLAAAKNPSQAQTPPSRGRRRTATLFFSHAPAVNRGARATSLASSSLARTARTGSWLSPAPYPPPPSWTSSRACAWAARAPPPRRRRREGSSAAASTPRRSPCRRGRRVGAHRRRSRRTAPPIGPIGPFAFSTPRPRRSRPAAAGGPRPPPNPNRRRRRRHPPRRRSSRRRPPRQIFPSRVPRPRPRTSRPRPTPPRHPRPRGLRDRPRPPTARPRPRPTTRSGSVHPAKTTRPPRSPEGLKRTRVQSSSAPHPTRRGSPQLPRRHRIPILTSHDPPRPSGPAGSAAPPPCASFLRLRERSAKNNLGTRVFTHAGSPVPEILRVSRKQSPASDRFGAGIARRGLGRRPPE